jgi:hypothetical protein
MPRPPAYGTPPRAVWQAMQSPARARYSPRAIRSAGVRVAMLSATGRVEALPLVADVQGHYHRGRDEEHAKQQCEHAARGHGKVGMDAASRSIRR